MSPADRARLTLLEAQLDQIQAGLPDFTQHPYYAILHWLTEQYHLAASYTPIQQRIDYTNPALQTLGSKLLIIAEDTGMHLMIMHNDPRFGTSIPAVRIEYANPALFDHLQEFMQPYA